MSERRRHAQLWELEGEPASVAVHHKRPATQEAQIHKVSIHMHQPPHVLCHRYLKDAFDCIHDMKRRPNGLPPEPRNETKTPIMLCYAMGETRLCLVDRRDTVLKYRHTFFHQTERRMRGTNNFFRSIRTHV